MKMSQKEAGARSVEFPAPTATDVTQLVTAKSLWTFEKEMKAVERNETAISSQDHRIFQQVSRGTGVHAEQGNSISM